MSLLFFDGFDGYSSNTELFAANPSLLSAGYGPQFYTTGGRFNGGFFRQFDFAGVTEYIVPAGTNELWTGFAFRPYALQSTSTFFRFRSAAGVEFSVGTDVARNLYVYRGTQGTGNLVASNTSTFAGAYITSGNANVPWFWIDIRYKWGNNNNGDFECWVNGQQKINLTNTNTVNYVAQTAITHMGICNVDGSGYIIVPDIDDWYILKVDGTAPNTRLGDTRIARVNPNTDFITSGTATPGPTYYTAVDDGATANTNDYITFNNTPGENVAFGVTALPSNATAIYGLSVITQQSKSDAGTANAHHLVISNGVQSNGSMFTLSTTTIKTKTYFPTDPETSAAWTNTAVANVKIGFGVEA